MKSFLIAGQSLASDIQHWAREFLIPRLRRHPRQVVGAGLAVVLGTGVTAFGVAPLAPDAATLPKSTVIEALDAPGLRDSLASQASLLDALDWQLHRSELTRANDTADTLLARLGLSDAAAAQFLRHDPLARQILQGRPGKRVVAEASRDGSLKRLVVRFGTDEETSFRRISVERAEGGALSSAPRQAFASRLESVPLVPAVRIAGGTIRTSLFAAIDDARLSDTVAIKLADIFSGDIDFHRSLRKGDRFSVVYEAMEAEGQPVRVGRILSAEFVNNGKTYQAVWFEERTPEGKLRGGYYTFDGQSLRKAFLASPLEFSRVTSGFAMRFHPILQTWRAHTGVDYAAPTGTPVRSVGDGVVDFAGWQNGYGNVVIVGHRNKAQTVYAHLSAIDVKKGQAVSQGQTIGKVGATGWATGPHLHFEYRENGVFKDPLTLAKQSEAVPVAAESRERFATVAQTQRRKLDYVRGVEERMARVE